MGKLAYKEEQALRDLLSANIRKYRRRRNLSQPSLAASTDLSTNFLADIEAGNTWVSSLTLIKLAKALDIEVYELLKPDKTNDDADSAEEDSMAKALLDRFSLDLTVALKNSVEKTVRHVRKEYEK